MQVLLFHLLPFHYKTAIFAPHFCCCVGWNNTPLSQRPWSELNWNYKNHFLNKRNLKIVAKKTKKSSVSSPSADAPQGRRLGPLHVCHHSPALAGRVYLAPLSRSPGHWAGSPSTELKLQPSLLVPWSRSLCSALLALLWSVSAAARMCDSFMESLDSRKTRSLLLARDPVAAPPSVIQQARATLGYLAPVKRFWLNPKRKLVPQAQVSMCIVAAAH